MATLYAPDTLTNQTDVSTAANFIKELWSDEVLAVYKANTVMVPLVQAMPFGAEKGDTVHVPTPARGAVKAKAAGTGVTIIVETAGKFDLLIDQHFEYSRIIEDIGIVRRVESQGDTRSIGIELIGLSDANIDELVKVTNLGALVSRRENTEQPQAEQPEATGVMAQVAAEEQ